MRPALQRIAAGAFAYVVSYVLVGLVTATRVVEYLPDSGDGLTVLEVYQSAGSPLWQAVGWFALNANGVPISVAAESGNVVAMENFLRDGSLWLGLVPGWLGLVPMAACLLVGAAVAVRRRPPSPVALGVGAYMVPGYLLAVLASTVAFSGTVGPVDASVTLLTWYPPERWLLPTLLAPLVFGSLGAFLGGSSVLESAVDDLLSGASLR